MKYLKIIIITITILLIFNTCAYANFDAENARSKVQEAAGYIVATIGFAICIYQSIKDVLEQIAARNLKATITIILQYAAIYYILTKIVMIFDLFGGFVGGIFG